LFIAGLAGCLKPPARVETPGAPAASQAVAPPGGSAAAPNANGVHLLPPEMGEAQKISGAAPQFPKELRHLGWTYVVTAKICVSNLGTVDSVSILAENQQALATNVVSAVNNWRFSPLTINGASVPFCYLGRFEFRAT
jgi:TonB family protein